MIGVNSVFNVQLIDLINFFSIFIIMVMKFMIGLDSVFNVKFSDLFE